MGEQREKLLRYYRGTEGAEEAERLVDLAEQAEKSQKFRLTDFLDPFGQEIAETIAANYPSLVVDFDGGYQGAERCRAVFKDKTFGGTPGFEITVVRAFTAYLLAHPGKKLTFMGAELGQWHEWNFASQLDWYLLENKENQQTQRFFKDINRFYLSQSPLWDIDFSWEGFEWLVADDNHNNVVVFVRRDRKGRELIAAVNFSPVGRADYRFGVPPKKIYREVFTTDLPAYGGTGDWRNEGELLTVLSIS